MINPWIVDFAAYDLWMKPLGLLMLGNALRRTGYQISFFDCLDRHQPAVQSVSKSRLNDPFYGTGHYIKEILSKPACLSHVPRNYGRYGVPYEFVRNILCAMQNSPDVICITSGMTYWYPGVFEMIALCREIYKGVPVILGGVYASLCPDHARGYSGADRVFTGPSIGAAVAEVSRLAGFQGGGEPSAENIPDYSVYANLRTAAVRMTTGCPFRCPFCASHLLSGDFSQRSPEEVVQEITGLSKSHAELRDIAFYDDALLVNAEHHFIPMLQKLCGTVPHVRFHTPNGLHPRYIDASMAALMFESGFKTIRLSYESISPDRQQAMGGKVSDTDLARAVGYLKAAGFTVQNLGCYVLMGLPGQDLEEIEESVRFVFSLGIRVNLASFSPIPGTGAWNEAVNSGLIPVNADPLLTNNSIFPLIKDHETVQNLIQLKRWTGEANQKLLKGESHLSHKGEF